MNLDLSDLVGLDSEGAGASVEGIGCLANGRLWRRTSGLELGVVYRLRLIWLACKGFFVNIVY